MDYKSVVHMGFMGCANESEAASTGRPRPSSTSKSRRVQDNIVSLSSYKFLLAHNQPLLDVLDGRVESASDL